MLVHIKGSFTLLGTIDSKPATQIFSFKVPVHDQTEVEVVIDSKEKNIQSFRDCDVSEKLLGILETNLFDGSSLEVGLKKELAAMTSNLSQATVKVLSLVKYCLNQDTVKEEMFSVKGYYWSKDKIDWKQLPWLLSGVADFHNFIFLKTSTADTIQGYIQSDFKPFLALKHLHRAKLESNPRYKYIDATIAAELAIKEFLIRKKPALKTLLLEMPSPPLHKLYGSILESFVNQRSPKLKEIQAGVERRNGLIHKPNDVDIDPNEANKYVQDVEQAIYHLLTLLYPDDPFFQTFSKPHIELQINEAKNFS